MAPAAEALRRRDVRSVMIKNALLALRPVFYSSSGNSMWPMVQDGDHCLFHPIQAVTAEDGSSIVKPASDIAVGDVVFCSVKPTGQFYAHFVRDVTTCEYDAEYTKYWIGGLQVRGNKRPLNGHCFRADIFGILKAVFVNMDGRYCQRPHPLEHVEQFYAHHRTRTLYETLLPLVLENEWCPQAKQFCEAFESPDMQPPSWTALHIARNATRKGKAAPSTD